MTTLAPIRRTTVSVELTKRELAVLDSALFDAMVRLLTDSKSFDITDRMDNEYLFEARMESDTIRAIQRKLDAARDD
jgi:hypothetical protein